MKKPKFLEKIKTEAVVASVLLVFLIGCGLFFVSGNGNNNDAFALTGTQAADPNSAQPANETESGPGELVYYTWTSGSEGYWYLVEIPGTLMTTTYYLSQLSDTVVNAADNSQSSESGSIHIIEGEDGEVTIVDDDGNDIDWNDLPDDVKQDLMTMFPELFDDSDNNETVDNNETNETEDDSGLYDYPEAEEEDLNLSDIEYGDDDGFADDFDDEVVPDENQTDESQNQTEDQTQDDTQNQTQDNETQDDTQGDTNETTVIDSGDDEIGDVEEVNPQDDEEEFPEDVPDDLPDDDCINDWING